MAAEIIDGKAIAARVRAEVAEQVRQLIAKTGVRPGLAAVRVGEDPASRIYVAGKIKACLPRSRIPLPRSMGTTGTPNRFSQHHRARTREIRTDRAFASAILVRNLNAVGPVLDRGHLGTKTHEPFDHSPAVNS